MIIHEIKGKCKLFHLFNALNKTIQKRTNKKDKINKGRYIRPFLCYYLFVVSVLSDNNIRKIITPIKNNIKNII